MEITAQYFVWISQHVETEKIFELFVFQQKKIIIIIIIIVIITIIIIILKALFLSFKNYSLKWDVVQTVIGLVHYFV